MLQDKTEKGEKWFLHKNVVVLSLSPLTLGTKPTPPFWGRLHAVTLKLCPLQASGTWHRYIFIIINASCACDTVPHRFTVDVVHDGLDHGPRVSRKLFS